MKKINLTVFISIFVCLLFSCSHGFLKDPRLYNTKKKTNNVIVVAPEPELQLTGGVDPFDDEGKWYNNPNEGFPHTDFETLSLVGTWFNDDNVPEYAMQKEDVWVSKDTSKSEFIHAKAPDTTGQGYGISNVNWYQYRGKNPLYAADGSYNTTLQLTSNLKPKLSRFYFYRFTGETLSPSLDNFLFAIDTYSKLMFAFAKPTASKSVFGNNVPTAWGPTDNEPYKDGTVYQFYMYDPVGYVEKAGSEYNVVLYEWFSNNLAKGIYDPTMGEAGNDFASKKPDGAGKSPFNNHTIDNFLINMKLFAGRTFMEREKTPSGGNGLKKYIYVISEDGTTLTKKTEVWNGLEDAPADVVYTIGQDENSTATKGILSGGDNAFSGFEVTDEGKTIVFNNGVTASTKFQDYGPQFLERIKNDPHYESEEDSYDFKVENPNSLIMNGDTYTYAGSPSDTNRTIYKKSILGVDWFYGVELNNSDYTVKMTRASSYNDIMWGTLGWEGNLKVEPKASFSDNVLNSSFHFRPKDDTGDGLYLYTWEFSEQGKIVTLKKTKWRMVADGTEITGVTVTNGNDEYNATASGISFKLSADMTTITVSGCSDPNGNGSFSRSFTDPGPSFLNRVKGAKYTGNGNSYQFDESGETLTYSVKFDWEDYINPFGPSASGEFEYDGVSSEKNNVIATYNGYRVHLTQNDTIIKMATVYGVGDASVMKWEAYRVN